MRRFPAAGLARERLAEILDEVVRMLETDRDTQEVLRRRRARPLARGPVLDQALGPPEARRVEEDLQTRGRAERRVPPAPHPEREHSAERRHLARRDRVPRMRGEPRV